MRENSIPPDDPASVPLAAQALAEATAVAMFARDAASQALGIAIVAMRPGYAKVTMTVRADMLNGHRTCHGAFIFAVADSAFAFSCNSHNRNSVAAGCHIDYLAPAFENDVLEAEAVEQSLKGRTGVYDVAVRNRSGVLIALFRGKSHRVEGEVLDRARSQ